MFDLIHHVFLANIAEQVRYNITNIPVDFILYFFNYACNGINRDNGCCSQLCITLNDLSDNL